MARRLIRRRRKYTWLPTNGTDVELVQGTTDFVSTLFQWAITLNANASYQATQIFPLNPFDLPVKPDAQPVGPGGSTLSDVVGNEYVVERMVGNHYAGVISSDSSTGAQQILGVMVGLGFFVARADDTNQNQPIGGQENYQVFRIDNQREPWMFRRTWLLNPRFQTLNSNPAAPFQANSERLFQSLPNWTSHYVGANTGPFFDVKSVRRIRTDERLFAAMSIHLLPILDASALSGTIGVYGVTDLRILGALRRAKNKSNF